jgi:dienelactone hydrolase
MGIADFRGDGKLDLAVQTGGSLQVFLGNGDGTFQLPLTFGVNGCGAGLAVGGFDESGRLGVAVANDTCADSVSILLQIPAVSLSATSLTFADQVAGTSSVPQTVTLTNTSGLTLTIRSIAVTGTDTGDFSETNTCGPVLAVGGRCTISVTFKPTVIGPRTASVTITDNAAGSPQTIALSGTGVVSGPNATLSATSLTFAVQLVGTTSPAQLVTLNNYGTATLTIASINFTGADPNDFAQTNTCGSSVGPGGSCTISVTFTPTQPGSRTATLAVTDNAPGSPQTVSLTGVGTVVELNPTSLSFGNVPVGQQSSPKQTTLTNVGSTRLNISSITITGADPGEFSQMNNCGTGIGGHGSCTITVTFRPSEQGSDSANVSVSDDGGDSPQQVPLSGTGCVWHIYRGHRKCGLLTMTSPVQSALTKSRSTQVPRVTGAHRVGTRVLDLVDLSRIDPFANDGLNRELVVRLWYPASAEQDCKLADYTSPRVWNYFAELTGLPLPAVTTNSCLDAPIADGEHPVVVFTHGYTGTFTDYTFLVEDLASRGYIVVSIDHTYEATAVEFPDERFVKSLVGSHLTNTWQTDDQTLSSALDVRLDDVKFVMGELERLNTSSGNAFAGRLDLTRLALAGHSLGGLTAWFGVQRDPRFKAAVLLDPYLSDIPFGSTETPVMLLTMGGEQRNEDECQLWSDLRGPRLAVNLRGAEHVTPSDLVWLAKGAVKTGPMGPDKTVGAIRDYIAAFLDASLQGRPFDRLLTGPSSEYPEAEVITQKQLLCGKVIEH